MALRHLSLKDFVLVTAMDLALDEGFTALTGETGAGKSILIDALQLVLGARGDSHWIRTGQPSCEIAAEFDLAPRLRPWLQSGGFDAAEDALLLRRSIDREGRSRGWINGSPATMGQLRELGEQLVDIYGQHAWQSLTRAAGVRLLFDAYAGVDMAPLQQAWQAWRQARQELDEARARQDNIASERERLLWQISELETLDPKAGQWQELNQQHSRLANAQALLDAARDAVLALEGDDDHGGVLAGLAQAQELLEADSEIEPVFAQGLQTLQDCLAQAEDLRHGLHAYLRQSEPDPEQLAALDGQLAQWLGLARRFRRQPEDLPALLEGWRQELAKLDSMADTAPLQERLKASEQVYRQLATQISKQRSSAAPELAKTISTAMQELGMEGGRFEVRLQTLKEAGSHGLEDIQFAVTTNRGQPPQLLSRVASGGELSRLALAIAVTTSAHTPAATLVFDEIDSGVGGAVAETVGWMLQQLGQDRQVLCVTHLPQVASRASRHLMVRKQDKGSGQTESSVQALGPEEREQEIARMLGGHQITATTLAHAQEMLTAPRPAARDKEPGKALLRKKRA